MTEIWVDQLTLKVPWSEFFTKLNDEWQGHTVYVPFILTYPLLLISDDPM